MSECYADMAGGDCDCPMCKYTETPEAKDAIKVGKIVHGQHQEITRLRAENAELRKLLEEIYNWTDYKTTPWAIKVASILGGNK